LALRSEDARLTEQALRVVLKSCDRAKHITGNLLVFARRQQATREKCRLSVLLDNTLALLEWEFRKQEIAVAREVVGDDTALCDPGQISQVFFNVLDNARQAMPQGGTVSIRIETSDEKQTIVIADDGVGIPRDLLEGIFEPFASCGDSKRERIGLGLPVAKTILESHQGRIEVESEEGQGTTVTLHLPQKTGGGPSAL
jgi:signal transduction histidine kinase